MNITARQAAEKVEELIAYANENLYLKTDDNVYIRNMLLETLKLKEPAAILCDDKEFRSAFAAPHSENGVSASEFQSGVLDVLLDYAAENGLCGNTMTEKILYETRLMGIVSPLPSFIIEKFEQTVLTRGVPKATDFLNDFSVKSNYIRSVDIDKNIRWETSGKFGKILVSINRSKPEKDPKEIEAAKNTPKGAYPKCPLCKDNVGFSGGLNQSARQTLRTIPILLNNENWQFQFSPYVYFRNHCIALSDEHRPMKVDKSAFIRMFDFTDLFRHFFIGSNAALPIVGGSILAHDHFQGGDKVLPVFSAPDRRRFQSGKYKNVSLSVVDWYNSVVRLKSANRADLIEYAAFVLEKWQGYRDESVGIIPFSIAKNAEAASGSVNADIKNSANKNVVNTNAFRDTINADANGSANKNVGNTNASRDTINADALSEPVKIPHNAVTAVARLEDDGTYILDMILRNNRTNGEFPFGIFHPPAELHNVKKEGIGIIEAMGLFILPGRLYEECGEIVRYLCGEKPLIVEELFRESNPICKHAHAVLQLANDNGLEMKKADAERAVTEYINSACEKILNCTAVFKNTEEGQAAFKRFIDTVL
ncbi:MAG: UDP-glucose--hexose-1-phosphate uridylyltransferase [Clostridiales bacterium]|jgi:UDPglucose--hexose-1-phosphate uridylyltransferase|nr:UDP-glucose--hexose-1-phosphate uridylyltransferase [Clostridiales bacterium]